MELRAAARAFATVAAAATLFAVGACTSDKKPSVASASSSSTTTSTAPASSSAPTTASAGPCTAPAPPASAINTSQADGDFDGDGNADTLLVYGTGTASNPSPYHVQIELANSKGRADAVIVDAATDDNQVVKALGGADITAGAGASTASGAKGDEAFAQIGSGASDSLVAVFQLDGCTITRLTGPQGNAPALFPIGGSVTHLDGLRCDGTAGGQRLVQLSATSDDGLTYQANSTPFTVDAGHLTAGTPVTETLDASTASDRLQAFSTLNCVGVQSP